MTEQHLVHKGSCLCGEISYEVTGDLRDVINCHCNQCLKFHGNYASYTNAKKKEIKISNYNKISWYKSSEIAKRGFCTNCGSSLFWDKLSTDSLSIAAGSLNKPTNLVTSKNIFIQDASDYYCINDNKKLKNTF